MKLIRIILLVFTFTFSGAFAQEIKTDKDIEENDSLMESVELPELIISRSKADAEALNQYLLLRNRVYKTYPYAKTASERLTLLNKNMAKLKTKKEKKQYFKMVENYIEDEFTGKLKKLSRKQGQILVKLICRQTGETTYDLVKDYKSGWKAFWASNTAKVFDINLKAPYKPYEVNEDYLIETILIRAFESGRLSPQPAAFPINYDNLDQHWQSKVADKK